MSIGIESNDRLKEQYKNDSNLNARLRLHSYNTNKVDWSIWCLNQMQIPDSARILELGCGNGMFWGKNLERVKEGWDITLSDFSPGMLESTRQRLNLSEKNFSYQVFDAQAIPYQDSSFDVVMAMHMLYFVPDIDKALTEVRRVLKSGGAFYATTNGWVHMKELKELLDKFDTSFDFSPAKYHEKFGIESGKAYFDKHFNNVVVKEYNGEIVVHEAEPIVAFVTSTMSNARSILAGEKKEEFKQYVQSLIDKDGYIRITTQSCILEGR